MDLNKTDQLINNFCNDIVLFNKINSWKNMSDNDIYLELFTCILGSQVKYEMAITYSNKLVSIINELLSLQTISNRLEKRIYTVLTTEAIHLSINKKYNSYRFPNKGSRNISHAISLINSDNFNLKSILSSKDYSTNTIRRYIVANFYGIGPKQASHFLKNIGYTDKIAILDSHIMKYLKIKLNSSINNTNISSLKNYEIIENEFITQTKYFDFPPVIVDQSIWFISRNGGL